MVETDHHVLDRTVAVGGQVFSVQVGDVRYDEVFLPLHGAHQADNAALAVAAVDALLVSEEPLDQALVDALGSVMSPGRLEPVRRDPTVPGSTPRTIRRAPRRWRLPCRSPTPSSRRPPSSPSWRTRTWSASWPRSVPVDRVIATQNSSERCPPAGALAEAATEVFGADAVDLEPDLAAAFSGDQARGTVRWRRSRDRLGGHCGDARRILRESE